VNTVLKAARGGYIYTKLEKIHPIYLSKFLICFP